MAIRPRQKPLWIRISGIAFYVLLCLSALAIGGGYSWVKKSPLLFSMMLDRIGIPPPPPKEIFGADSINVLLLGCDEDRVWGRYKPIREKARSDLMLVAKVDFKQRRISGVSIPRDTLVSIPGYAEQKINAYYAIGGRQSPEMAKELAKQAAESVVGVLIDRVVVVDYKALQEMVDLVGGVDLYVKKPMSYQDKAGQLYIDLKPGRQRLNGYKAMGFVRYRKDIGSDFARQERQKEFLLAFKDSLNKSLGQLPAVINKAVQAMGGGVSETEINSLTGFAMNIGGSNINFGQIPVVDAPNYNLRVDTSKLPAVLAQYHLIEAPIVSGRVSSR